MKLTNDLLKTEFEGKSLEDWLDPAGTLVVFLRHFGCTYCREMVGDLRLAVEQAFARGGRYPPVLIIHGASSEQSKDFFAGRWPQARTIADPTQILYRAFGVGRGTAKDFLSPSAMICAVKGLAKGYGVGAPKSDPWLMPGVFYVRNAEIIWHHDFAHAGDHPDFAALPKRLSAL